MKSRGTLVLYALVVGTFVLMLGWWIVFFVRQGELLVERADAAGAALSAEQAAAVERAAHASLRMFLFEGAFLILVLFGGVWLVMRSMRREVLLHRQQRDFLSAVTHELRSPLASASLYLQSLQLGRVSDDKRERYLRHALEDLERLSALVERVLESARVSRGPIHVELERLDLAEFARRTVGELVGPARARLEVEFDAPQPVPVDADSSALETILGNLVSNAVKYGGKPGRLRVRVQRVGAEARLEVRDFGPGLAGTSFERVFDPFVRGEHPLVKSQPGVGLGLFLVAELVRALGGHVSARNATEGGGGFSVEIALPLAVAEG